MPRDLASTSGSMKSAEIPPGLRDDLLTYVFATSEERARIMGELTERNSGMADLLIDLEANELRARFEMELLDE